MKQLYLCIFALFPCLSQAQTAKEWFEQGQKAYQEKSYEKAIECFEKSSKLDKNNPEPCSLTGQSFIHLKEFSKAIPPLKQAQNLRANEARYYYYHAVALDSMGKETEALKVTDKAIKVPNNLSELYVLRGDLYFRKKDYNTSIANLNKAIELDRKNGLAYLKRGTARYRVVDSAGACSDWKIAYQLGKSEAKQFLDENCKE